MVKSNQISPFQGPVPLLKRVSIKNYKSIGKADISLGRLTVLIGRNGSGKSNFLDALRFVADGLQTSLDHAVKSRGGIDEVRRRSTGHPRNFAIQLEVVLPEYHTGLYSFEVTARERGGFVIRRELLRVQSATGAPIGSYTIEDGKVKDSSVENAPPAFRDRLYLVTAAGFPAYEDRSPG